MPARLADNVHPFNIDGVAGFASCQSRLCWLRMPTPSILMGSPALLVRLAESAHPLNIDGVAVYAGWQGQLGWLRMPTFFNIDGVAGPAG